MTNDEIRMTNKFQNPNAQFGIKSLELHSTLGLRYLSFFLITVFVISFTSIPSFAQENTASSLDGSLGTASAPSLKNSKDGAASPYAQFIGEAISYDVQKLVPKAALAKIEFKGLVPLDGRQVYLITFEAKGFKMFDIEKIYADPKTLYPVHVERNLNVSVMGFGGFEGKIIESYDQQKHTVTVTQFPDDGSKPAPIILQKDGPIDNLYCFIYRYRLKGDFKLDTSLKMNLPTKDVLIRIIKKMSMNVVKKTYDTFFFETVPAQYRIWFDAADTHVPVRIENPALIGGTIMTMSNYSKGK